MKKDIHPNYQPSTIDCACGNSIRTRSVMPRIQVDVCSACHPFFTGKQKLMDTAGRIDRFKKKFQDKIVGAKKSTKAAPVSALRAKAADMRKANLQALRDKVKAEGK
ncbi:MAG TPA: 50S ribosomal protein L31 [Candidatus Omnitrophota bacterium]|jgi:large subunit ribosomal protein L31|nr:MAG: 50S ribosomal protein L31 [Candidatus Omnitrophica bacterium ADurb.Bin314]HOE68913.1 50S ribosomal protein L31 [Candidatus Omnitrophota bacterium]HPW64515.1 50S ribosomal protein L31 [Candidatus Omnitrophota bacterium]HQB93716.1 50S ribosomal protein L31 [Candidatus Omnitrophota bacterium]